MKYILSILLFFVFFMNTSAQFVSVKKAEKIASEFIRNNYPQTRISPNYSLSLVYESTDTIQTKTSGNNSLFYIFNIKDEEGFIIVSADERTSASILGYSFKNDFKVKNIPDNIQYWMDSYKNQIISLRRTDNNAAKTNQSISKYFSTRKKTASTANTLRTETTDTLFIAEKELTFNSSSFSPDVKPLVKTTWDQDQPYNNLTPLDGRIHSATGCVATAAAQIMKFHEWPVQGKGNISYNTLTKRIHVLTNFNASIYDWRNMLDSYRSFYSDKEANAVATLMRDTGSACMMDYTHDESGASIFDMGIGFIEHFDYTKQMNLNIRDFYTDQEWKNILKEQLNKNLPVLYSGANKSEGHAFICDGYDSNDLFHINWGWSGYCDGYFEINKLNPSSPGIGGGSGKFNEDQMIISDIRQASDNDKSYYNFYYEGNAITCPGKKILKRNESFEVMMYFYNYSFTTFNGTIALGLKRPDKKIMAIGTFETELEPLYGYEDLKFTNLRIPANLPDGEYSICAYTKTNGDKEWSKIRASLGISDSIKVFIENDKIYLGEKSNEEEGNPKHFDLSVEETFITDDSYIETNEEVSFHARVKNIGGKDYEDPIGIYISKARKPQVSLIIWTPEDILIKSDSTCSINLSGKMSLEPGFYNTHLIYKDGKKNIYFMDKYSTITIHSEAVGNEKIQTSPIKIFACRDAGKIIVKGNSLQQITLYDMSGKMLANKICHNTSETDISSIIPSQKMIIISIKADNKPYKYKIRF